MPANLSLFINIEHTALQLINQLANYENKKCKIIVLSKEALFLATFIARQLKTGIMFMPAETLKDTVEPLNSMNVPTIDYMTIQAVSPDASRNSMCHRAPTTKYPETSWALASMFKERYVILVCGNSKSSDRVISCVKSIQRQKPRRVVAVVPTLTRKAALEINREVDDLVFNYVISEAEIDNAYPEFNTIADTGAYPLKRVTMKNVLKTERLNEN